MGWMEMLHGVRDSMLDNVDGLATIGVDCRVGVQAQEHACNDTCYKRDGCRENEELLHDRPFLDTHTLNVWEERKPPAGGNPLRGIPEMRSDIRVASNKMRPCSA